MPIRYEVVEEKTTWELVEEVNRWLKLGWELYGSMVIISDAAWHHCYQPMIKQYGLNRKTMDEPVRPPPLDEIEFEDPAPAVR
jgi:hypothetical protein